MSEDVAIPFKVSAGPWDLTILGSSYEVRYNNEILSTYERTKRMCVWTSAVIVKLGTENLRLHAVNKKVTEDVNELTDRFWDRAKKYADLQAVTQVKIDSLNSEIKNLEFSLNNRNQMIKSLTTAIKSQRSKIDSLKQNRSHDYDILTTYIRDKTYPSWHVHVLAKALEDIEAIVEHPMADYEDHEPLGQVNKILKKVVGDLRQKTPREDPVKKFLAKERKARRDES